MRIVFVTTESFIDHSYTIAAGLRKKVDLRVFILAKRRTEEIQNWCSDLDAEYIERKRYRNPLNIFSELKFIIGLKKLKADKIWFNALNLYQVIPARLLLKNIIISLHDVEFHPALKDYFSLWSYKLTLLLFRRKICTTSRCQAEIFKYIYGFEPKTLQLPIIDYYDKVTANNLSKKTEHHNRLFFFGSIYPYKGIEILIQAAKILINKNLDFHLAIYGKIKYNSKEIKSELSKLKNIKLFDDYISYKDVRRIFNDNNLLILPYRQVTQCGPLLIGYNSNVPAICTDFPGFREYVDNHKSGFLFNGTPEDLADKIEFLLANRNIIKESKTYIETEIRKKFSMQNLADNYISIFKS